MQAIIMDILREFFETSTIHGLHYISECDVPVPGIPGTGNFSFFWWYRNRYRKKMVPEKSPGTGIGEIWYRKNVSEPVSEKFGTGKSLGTGIGKIW